jgi:hypothetical protein
MDLLPAKLKNKKVYDYYYAETGKLNAQDHPLVQGGLCSVQCMTPTVHDKGAWASTVTGLGTVGVFSTREEAVHRAFWYVCTSGRVQHCSA